MIKIETLDLGISQKLAEEGVKVAKQIQSPSNIAIVDAFGYLITHVRMDNAPLPSIEHSINKAYTSAMFKKPTHLLQTDSEPKGSLYGVNLTLNQRVIVFAGGFPLFNGDNLVGSVGVSGGTADQDHEIAESIFTYFKKSFTAK